MSQHITRKTTPAARREAQNLRALRKATKHIRDPRDEDTLARLARELNVPYVPSPATA